MKKAVLLFCLLCFYGCSSWPKSMPAELATLQEESRPIRYIFVSEPTGNDGAPIPENSLPITEKIVRAILPALTEGQRLYFVGSKQSFARLQESQKPQPAAFGHISARPYMWLQDLFEFGETKSGLSGFMSYGNLSVKDTADEIIRSIAGPRAEIRILKSKAVHGTVGGNFEKWPGDIGVIGSSDFESSQAAADFARQVFPQEFLLPLPTSWLAIGHTDELIKFVRYRAGDNCEIQLLVNSPDAALRALRKGSQEPFLGELVYEQTRIAEIKSIQEFCRRGGLNCRNPRNGEIAASLQAGELSEGLTAVRGKINELKSLVQNAYRERLPACKVRWIEAPSLHLVSLKGNQLVPQAGQSVFPSLTNGLLINETYIVADPGNAGFRKDFTAKMAKAGFEVKYVPFGKDLFQGGAFDGHVHCMTQLLRR